MIRNETGSTYGVATFSGSALYTSLALAGTSAADATAMLKATGTLGAFVSMQNSLGTALNTYGAASTYIDNQVSYNSDKIDAMNSGLGSLVDADLSKEAAMLSALQTRQQLGTQALSIANQAPSSLLSLFRG